MSNDLMSMYAPAVAKLPGYKLVHCDQGVRSAYVLFGSNGDVPIGAAFGKRDGAIDSWAETMCASKSADLIRWHEAILDSCRQMAKPCRIAKALLGTASATAPGIERATTALAIVTAAVWARQATVLKVAETT